MARTLFEDARQCLLQGQCAATDHKEFLKCVGQRIYDRHWLAIIGARGARTSGWLEYAEDTSGYLARLNQSGALDGVFAVTVGTNADGKRCSGQEVMESVDVPGDRFE